MAEHGGAEYVRCPAPECRATIKVSSDLPVGVYCCMCKAVEVRLERPHNGPAMLSLSDGTNAPAPGSMGP